MAMLYHLDLGVGRVVETLKKEGLWENTLLIFVTDNGGSKAMSAINTPLRGFKQENYEGGIRTPFSISWPARFKGGRSIATPVVSLDILPTALTAAGVGLPTDRPLDGKSLLPLLTGETRPNHENLFWSEGGSSGEWAVRSGDWKLVAAKEKRELFNLAADPVEARNLVASSPDKVVELTKLYDAWLDEMAEPMDGVGKRWNKSAEPAAEQKKNRKAEK